MLNRARDHADDVLFLLTGVLANVTDKSAIARLDTGVAVNTYLRVEAYVAGHASGPDGGEFRLKFGPQQVDVEGVPVAIPRVRAPMVDAGIALRVNL